VSPALTTVGFHPASVNASAIGLSRAESTTLLAGLSTTRSKSWVAIVMTPVWVAFDVLGFTGLWSGGEVEGVVYEHDSYGHDVGFPVRIGGCQPGGVPIRSSSLWSLSDFLLQTLVDFLPLDYGGAVAIKILL
jgi:hypothetical protein